MEKDLQKIIEALRNVHMTESEKNTIYVSLLQKIGTGKAVPSPYTGTWLSMFVRSQKAYVLALCLIILFGSSSLILGAQGSLPGDVLYPIKTGVSEPVLRVLSKSSPVSSAQFEVSIMETRLSEAQQLADKGDLQPQNKQKIADSVAEQTKRVEEAVDNLTDTSDLAGNNTEAIVPSADIGTTTAPVVTEEATGTSSTSEKAPESTAIHTFTKMRTTETSESVATTTVTASSTTDIATSTRENNPQHKRERRDIIEKVDGLLKKYQPTIQLLENSTSDTKSED